MLNKSTYKLPKLQPPRLDSIYLRHELFRQFDEHSNKRVMWISAPAGSGKTTAVASYLAEKNRPILWFQVDEGDEDIASFYYYLGIAGQAASPKKKVKFPLLTPEYSGRLSVFTRNFFRHLFAEFPANSVLVFDNFQDASDGCALTELLPIALSEIPYGITVIIISRYDPPNSLVRARLQSDFSLVDADAFKLNNSECVAIAKRRKNETLSLSDLENIQSLSQGWMAGFILLLEYTNRGRELDGLANNQSQNAIFDYFATEVFHDFNVETQDFLLKTSILPTVNTDVAKQLTGLSRTKHILKTLYRQRFFIIQHDNLEQSFQYHPLFQEFLRNQAEQKFSKDELRTLGSKAGQLLMKAGELDAAAALLVQGENWNKFEVFLNKHAQNYINQGRHTTLEVWLKEAPKAVLEGNPWLLYWFAHSKQQLDPIGARPLLEHSFALFKSNNVASGLYRAWANIIESFIFAWDTFKPIRHWLEEFDNIQKLHPRIQGLELKARVSLAVFSAMVYGYPQHPDFPMRLKQVETLYRFFPIEFLKAMIGGQLSFFYMFTGNMTKYGPLQKEAENFIRSEKIPPLTKLYSIGTLAAYQFFNGDLNEMELNTKHGQNFADKTGIDLLLTIFHGFSIQQHCIAGEGVEAQKHLDVLAHELDSKRQLDYAYYHYLAARTHFIQGDIKNSYDNCLISMRLFNKLSFTFPAYLIQLMLAQHFTYKEEYDEALSLANSVIEFGTQGNFLAYIFMGRYVKGFIHLKKKEFDQAESDIRAALKLGRVQGYFSDMLMTLPVFRAIFVWALKQGIETNYVKEVIRRRGFAPSHDERSIPNWPWPIKINTLGQFSVLLNNEPIDKENKSAHKPLSLLKVVIAFGGRKVSEEKVCDALWPDSEGDKAQQNIKTTLHRLRKLLKRQDVILLNNHQLSLNESCCWLDLWDLYQLLDVAENQIPLNNDNIGKTTQLCEQLFKRYGGEFLTDDNSFWTIETRNRIQSRYNKFILHMAYQLEINGHWDYAIRCYQQSLENDPLPEEAYQGLMRSYYSKGLRADAVKTYQDCKETYTSILGISPSRQTETLHNKILSKTL